MPNSEIKYELTIKTRGFGVLTPTLSANGDFASLFLLCAILPSLF